MTMADVTTYGYTKTISEEELTGMLCYLNDNDIDINLEVTMHPHQKLIPRTWGISFNSSPNKHKIKEFCDTIQKPKDIPHIEVRPSDSKNKDTCETVKHKTYYIIESEDFIRGYTTVAKNFIINCVPEEDICLKAYIDEDYKSLWKPDSVYIQQSKLIAKPTEEVKDKKFDLGLGYYVWDLPSCPDLYQEQLIANLVGLFLAYCSGDDHGLLIDTESYLRFMLYQDAPDSTPYVYAYIRQIKDCTFRSHKLILAEARTTKLYLPCEINLSETGYFYEFLVDEWNTKDIKFIGSFA